MKKIKLVLFLLFTITAIQGSFAQVGIGTATPAAQLDVPASNAAAPANNDGILIPRINTFPGTNPTALQQGMLVFLTTISGANQPGFYYWNNPTTAWIGIGNNLNANWTLLGNSGTASATNFIGTTDDKDIVFKRNNVRAGFIGNPNIASGNKNTSFGANSLNAAGTGTRNTAIGTNVMPTNSAGSLNVAIGEQSMFSNTIGIENTAIGVGSLYSSSLGSCNVAVGRNALTSTAGTTGTEGSNNTGVGYVALRSNTTGAYNSAFGRDALNKNTIGNNNLALGYQAGFNNIIGSNNVFVGNMAGLNEITSNKLYIDNSGASATAALIYGEFSSTPKILRTNSEFQIGDPAGTGYKFPIVRGTNKQVLETDATGTLSWVTPNSTLSVVRTNMTANQSLTTAGWQKVNFDLIQFDSNSEFTTGSARFTAAKTGYYQVNAGFHTFSQSDNQYYSIGVFVNGAPYQETTANHFGVGPVSRNINCLVSLAAGQYIEIYAQNYQAGVNLDSYSGKSFFEVQQIK